MLPLLGLMGLAGGALGQQWYWDRRGDEEQARARGILGTRPEQLAGDVAGPPNPGTGLLGRLARDPGDPGLQLDFQAGLMGMPRRERAVANQLFDQILGRASQARENQIGRQFQAGENRLGREQAEAHYQGTEVRIANQFERQMEHNKEQFAFEREKFGDEFAFRQKQHRDQQALGWASENRQANTAALNNAETRLDILKKQQGLLEGPEVKLPTGYRPVTLPSGEVVAAPVKNVPDWTKAQEGVDAITTARQNIAAYQEHFKTHGPQRFGGESGRQKQHYERVVEALRVLKNTGVLNVGEVPILREELPDPTALSSLAVRDSKIMGQLTALDETFARQEQILRERYKGWQLNFMQRKEADKGREAPPTGSVDISGGSGRYGGRGSSR